MENSLIGDLFDDGLSSDESLVSLSPRTLRTSIPTEGESLICMKIPSAFASASSRSMYNARSFTCCQQQTLLVGRKVLKF